MAQKELQCYNKGCGQKYDAEKNVDGCCQHHPGVPVFHDALKGWSCCKKRSTDFTEFLNIPGCTLGVHSNEKPAEPEKPKCEDGDKNEVNVQKQVEIIKSAEPLQRPSADSPMMKLPITVAATLKQALSKLKEMSLEAKETKEEIAASEGIVTVGTACKNSGCQKSYEDESSNIETCIYHTGVPIFHEGMKYWSCCKRKTSDFNSFLSQEGCTEGHHLWFKKEDPGEKKVSCRYDWHQTGSFVTISVFSKVALPEKSCIEANPVAVRINIAFDGGKSVFSEHIVLKGVIDPEKSTVKMLGTKVEINLKKAEPGTWSTLEQPSIA